jgi:type II secretory pathway pseudopilin PulG
MMIRAPLAAGRACRSVRSRKRQQGFTLIEAALTTVIISTGVLAILSAQQAFHRKNDWAQRSGTAMMLANELRELTVAMPKHDPFTGLQNVGPEPGENSVADYDDIDDFAGVVTAGVGAGITFNPPINALRQPVLGLPGWSQRIEVASVLPDNISSTFAQPLGTTDLLRVTVTVIYQHPDRDPEPKTITTLSWVVGK